MAGVLDEHVGRVDDAEVPGAELGDPRPDRLPGLRVTEMQAGLLPGGVAHHRTRPALPDNPQGVSFDKLDGDAGSTHIDATQCEGDGS